MKKIFIATLLLASTSFAKQSKVLCDESTKVSPQSLQTQIDTENKAGYTEVSAPSIAIGFGASAYLICVTVTKP